MPLATFVDDSAYFSAEQKATLLQAVEGQLLSDSQQALVLAGGGEAFKLISDGDLQAIEVSVKKLELNSAVNALSENVISAEQKATLLQAVEG